MIDYLMQLTVVWAVLLSFYFVATRGNGDWRLHRRLLLLCWLTGFAVPLIGWLEWSPVDLQVYPTSLARWAGSMPFTFEKVVGLGADSATNVSASGVGAIPVYVILLACWLLGSLIAAIRLFILVVLRPTRDVAGAASVSGHGPFRIIHSTRGTAAYALFGRIFLPPGMDPELEPFALAHEAAHLRHGHDYERLLLALGSVVLWFHPLQWLFGRRLAAVQEFEADAGAVSPDRARDYGRHLLRHTQIRQWSPGLLSSPLKQRIMHLITPPTPRRFGLLRSLALLVLVVTLAVACSDTAVETLAPDLENAEITPARLTSVPADATDLEATRKWLETVYGEVRYPAEARNTGTTGRVTTTLAISASGDVTIQDICTDCHEGQTETEEVVIIGYGDGEKAGTGPDRPEVLEAEVKRMVRFLESQGITPALVDGRPVASTQKLHFTFKLE